MSPLRRNRKRSMSIRECRALVEEEQFEKLVSPEVVVREAVRLVQEAGIVFIDEIDKICQRRGEYHGGDASAEGVQVFLFSPLSLSFD